MKLFSFGVFLFLLISTGLALYSCNKNNDATAPLQNGMYKNGTLSTGPVSSSGVTAPAGTTWSECQADLSTNTSNWAFGIGNFYNNSQNIWVADDFKVPAGQTWNITKISFYGIVWNVTSNAIDTLHLQIWNGKPGTAGAAVIYGDTRTNFLSTVTDSLIYGIQNSTIPSPGVAPNTENKFWKLSANVNLQLSAGTYWLAWQTHALSGVYAFTPYVILKNARTDPSWNSIIKGNTGIWSAFLDQGNPSTAPDLPQDLPFEIVYTY